MSRASRTGGSEGPPPRESPRLPPRIRAAAYPKRAARDRSSPRIATPEAAAQKKAAGARVADLEARLAGAEEELRKLKEQLVSPGQLASPEPSAEKAEESEASSAVEDSQAAAEAAVPPEAGGGAEEMLELETRLWKTERELAACQAENEELRRRAAEAEARGRAREDALEGEVRELEGRAEEEARARAEAEAEIGRLRVQMEQWRKAAHAAAAIVCAEGEGAAEAEEGKRKSSVGKRVLVELWRRKGAHNSNNPNSSKKGD